MPKITVEIEWDQPEDEYWLNPDNIAIALHAHCKNTKFIVRDVVSHSCSPLPSVPIRVISPCVTIQHAIDKADPGDEIHVMNGTHAPSNTMI